MRASFLLVMLLVGACARSTPSMRPDALTVASDLDNLPFAGVDASGRAVGRDVEMMRRLAAEIGRELEWKRIAFDELLPTLERGEVDAVCATLGVTPEREQRFAFTRPYYATSIALVSRAGAFEARSIEALAGKRVAASAGTTSERAVRLHAADAVLVVESKQGSTVAERLASGDLDAAAMDAPAARALVDRSGGALELWPVALEPERYAIALRKDDRRLVDELDAALAKLEAEGALAELDLRFGVLQPTELDARERR